MALKAMDDEMASMVHLTMGRSSFRVSQALRYMGFNLLPDTDYMKFEFEMDADRCIAYVRGNLKQLATVHKWELELIGCQHQLGIMWFYNAIQHKAQHQIEQNFGLMEFKKLHSKIAPMTACL